MKIELCVLVHNFQKRLCWLLSSIKQQVGDLPDIVISVASLVNQGDPSTEEVIGEFRLRGLNIKHMICDRDTIAQRGLTRNRHILERDIDTDYMFFSDCDHIYEETFFAKLKQVIGGPGQLYYSNCSFKKHTIIEETNELVNSFKSLYILNAYKIADTLNANPDIHKRKIASGSIQIVHVEDIKKIGNTYTGSDHAPDAYMFRDGRKCRSDRGFRWRLRDVGVGSKNLRKLPRRIHLDHNKDTRGHHIEEQR